MKFPNPPKKIQKNDSTNPLIEGLRNGFKARFFLVTWSWYREIQWISTGTLQILVPGADFLFSQSERWRWRRKVDPPKVDHGAHMAYQVNQRRTLITTMAFMKAKSCDRDYIVHGNGGRPLRATAFSFAETLLRQRRRLWCIHTTLKFLRNDAEKAERSATPLYIDTYFATQRARGIFKVNS